MKQGCFAFLISPVIGSVTSHTARNQLKGGGSHRPYGPWRLRPMVTN